MRETAIPGELLWSYLKPTTETEIINVLQGAFTVKTTLRAKLSGGSISKTF